MRYGTMILLAAVLLAPAAGAADAKIALVNMEKVVRAFDQTKTMEAALDEQVIEARAERDELLAAEKALKTELETLAKEAQNPALSEAEREKREATGREKLKELARLQGQIRDLVRKRQKELTDQQSRMQEQILAKLNAVIAEYASEKGLDLVIDSASTGLQGGQTVIYFRKEWDITGDILERIKAK